MCGRDVSAWTDCLCSPRPGWPASVGSVAAWEKPQKQSYNSCSRYFQEASAVRPAAVVDQKEKEVIGGHKSEVSGFITI